MDAQSYLTTLNKTFQLQPVFAVELEFYVADDLSETEILQKLDSLCDGCHQAEKERGKTQYEVALKPIKNVAEFVQTATNLRQIIADNFAADFSAKPYPDDYGSALHFHIHLENKTGTNVFTRDEDGTYSPALLHTLGGLLSTMKQNLSTFSPNDTTRFYEHGKHSPTHICWGGNNRSVALRLPDKPLDNKHIEHRLAAADADIAACVEAILEGVTYGLQNEFSPAEPIYGNAWDSQYGLEPLLDQIYPSNQ